MVANKLCSRSYCSFPGAYFLYQRKSSLSEFTILIFSSSITDTPDTASICHRWYSHSHEVCSLLITLIIFIPIVADLVSMMPNTQHIARWQKLWTRIVLSPELIVQPGILATESSHRYAVLSTLLVGLALIGGKCIIAAGMISELLLDSILFKVLPMMNQLHGK